MNDKESESINTSFQSRPGTDMSDTFHYPNTTQSRGGTQAVKYEYLQQTNSSINIGNLSSDKSSKTSQDTLANMAQPQKTER